MARILVADDEPAIAMAIRDELLFEGFDVQHAQDGHGALALARTWQPAVLVLDLMLPGRNGFDVCRTLRPEQPALWIILLTVRGQEVDRFGLAVELQPRRRKDFYRRVVAEIGYLDLHRVGAAVLRGDQHVDSRAGGRGY